jgi:GTP-binding protein
MSFLDEAVITVQSGDGGDGCISFRREKFIPKGGPDGGDGGDGGSIILRSTRNLRTLNDYRPRRFLRAKNGAPGRGKNRSGKKAADLYLSVPVGTVIKVEQTQEVIADLIADNQEVILVSGGKGGKGNQHFATPTQRTPRTAEKGQTGRELKIRLELKILADIGLIGLPNAGKSTLLSRLTRARPKIGSFPFTTLAPNLGVLGLDNDRDLIVADIPGLIEGASSGRGLGHRFLKHIERTRLLLHILDLARTANGDPLADFDTVNREMETFSPALTHKPQIVLLNKIDLEGRAGIDCQTTRKALEARGLHALPISALTGQGLEELRHTILERWTTLEME